MNNHLVLKLRRRVPEPPPIPDWITYITDKSVTATALEPSVDAVLANAGLRVRVTHEYTRAGAQWSATEIEHGLDRCYRLILDDADRVPAGLLDRLVALAAVESAHELEVSGSAFPPPAADARSLALARPRSSRPGVQFAHTRTRGNPEVTVAVLDTGVDVTHPELAGKVVRQADFVNLRGLDTSSFIGDFLDVDDDADDEQGHGTHVAGIIAGEGREMDEGVAPGCRILAVRVLATLREDGRTQGAGIVDNINPAIKWAVDNGASVINMSLGIRHTGGGLPHADVIRYALDHDVTVVAASGNDGTATKYYPGALPGVVAVGAVDDDGQVASFTSYGAPITVVAPGTNVLSSFAHGRYAVASGTSQASPFVAGAIALLKSFALDNGVRLTGAAIASILRETSDKSDRRLRTNHAGYGTVNLTDALKWLINAYT